MTKGSGGRAVAAGIDVSTTGVRVALVDADGQLAGGGAASFTDSGTTARELQDAGDWIEALDDAFEQALQSAPGPVDVASLAVASQGITVVPTHAGGEPAGPAIGWLTSLKQTVFSEAELADWFSISARWLTSAYLPTQAQQRSQLGEAPPDRWCLVGETLTARLTGENFLGPCLAATTGLLDPVTRDWSDELLARAGVDRSQLAQVRELDDGGRLIQDSARRRRWSARDGAVVAPPTQDQRAASVMADPAGRALVITTGTASGVIARIGEPLIDPAHRIPLTPAWGRNEWELEGVVGAAGAALDWAARSLDFANVNALLDFALGAPVGSGGVQFEPHLAGATSPVWDEQRRSAFTGLSLSTLRSDLARSVVEGVCREVALNVSLIEELAGRRDEIVLIGGLTRHQLIGTTLASMLDRPLTALRSGQPTALGAAARAASAAGWDVTDVLASTIRRDALRWTPVAGDVARHREMGGTT